METKSESKIENSIKDHDEIDTPKWIKILKDSFIKYG